MVEVESVCGVRPRTEVETEILYHPRNSGNLQKITDRSKAREKKGEVMLDDTVKGATRGLAVNESDTPPSSSDESDIKKPRKKKKKKNVSKKRQSRDSSSSPSSDHSSDSSSSRESSSENSSQAEDAELCYEITEFESADLPDLPDRWDKGFRKLRSYVPLTLFNTALLENPYNDEGESKSVSKSTKLKSSLKNLERQLTYGDFIEMSDLEERYAREIYGLDMYADYVVKHKKIVSDLKKTYNCWMIGL